jgi:hypothetical protein
MHWIATGEGKPSCSGRISRQIGILFQFLKLIIQLHNILRSIDDENGGVGNIREIYSKSFIESRINPQPTALGFISNHGLSWTTARTRRIGTTHIRRIEAAVERGPLCPEKESKTTFS